ncbi:unnamed protein product [Ectocarpus sp. 12 AP-2014]
MSALLRGMIGVLCLFTLVACQEDGGDEAESASIFPNVIAEKQESCLKDGGRWGPATGNNTFTCFITPSDANTACSKESDCQGLCLARSRTCAPVIPFFGCHQVLSSSGTLQTRCRQ